MVVSSSPSKKKLIFQSSEIQIVFSLPFRTDKLEFQHFQSSKPKIYVSCQFMRILFGLMCNMEIVNGDVLLSAERAGKLA